MRLTCTINGEPRAVGMWKAAISSSGSSTLRLGPVMKSSTAMLRVPRVEATSIVALLA